MEFYKRENLLKNKKLAIKTSNSEVADLMLENGAEIIFDESGATRDSNILEVARDFSAPLILGNSILFKYGKEEFYNDKPFTILDKFINSLLERIELLHSRRIRM